MNGRAGVCLGNSLSDVWLWSSCMCRLDSYCVRLCLEHSAQCLRLCMMLWEVVYVHKIAGVVVVVVRMTVDELVWL